MPGISKSVIAFAAAMLMLGTTARAEHFAISLTIETAHDRGEAHADTDPPAQGLDARPACHLKARETFTLQFFLSSSFPHGTKKGVTIHYYIAPEKAAGVKAPRLADKPAVLEGTFLMDFKPDGKVGLRQQLHIDRPGAYLVRVESQHSDSDHEHFAALDLVVE